MDVVLISTYELGHQPFGLASPAAWLRARGHGVRCIDVSREMLDESAVRQADLIAFYVPMHTAARLAIELIEPIRQLNPRAALCFYGLYAPVNEAWLRGRGIDAILGGEFEQGLADLADRLARAEREVPLGRHSEEPAAAGDEESASSWDEHQCEPVISLARQNFLVPDRTGLVPLQRYAGVVLPDGQRRVAGYTEASRGCKHRCRHCPIVPVYDGVFRVVQPEVVLEDIRRQVAAGAEHITFGDPDFFNGPRHALEIVRALHAEFPELTYDVTIKVEHLLARQGDLAMLRDTGCLFVTTAVEALDDGVLAWLEKGHTRADFFELVRLFRETGMVLHPTFVPFTPWTTLESYVELLDAIESLELIENVAPVQLAIRLLVPAGSRLLELEDIRKAIGSFDSSSLTYPWRHADARVDCLQREIEAVVKAGEERGASRSEIFRHVRGAARRALGQPDEDLHPAERARPPRRARATIPYLTEPWYC